MVLTATQYQGHTPFLVAVSCDLGDGVLRPSLASDESVSTDDDSDEDPDTSRWKRGRVGSRWSSNVHSDCTWKTTGTSANLTEGHGVMKAWPPTTPSNCTARGEKKSVIAVCFTATVSEPGAAFTYGHVALQRLLLGRRCPVLG